MSRFIANRADIDADTLAKFERSWGHTGGNCQAAILDCDSKRIVSWHKTRRAAQSAFSRHANSFAVR